MKKAQNVILILESGLVMNLYDCTTSDNYVIGQWTNAPANIQGHPYMQIERSHIVAESIISNKKEQELQPEKLTTADPDRKW